MKTTRSDNTLLFSVLPIYILVAYQTFITHNDLQIAAFISYNLSITLAMITSWYYPIVVHASRTNLYIEQIESVYTLMIPLAVILSLGYVDNMVGIAVLTLFAHFVLKPLSSYRSSFVYAFLFMNLFTYDQEAMMQETLAVDSRYNYEESFLIINCLCLFVITYRNNHQYFFTHQYSDIGINIFNIILVIVLSRSWTRDSNTQIPLMLNWFNSDNYSYFWNRTIMIFGLLGTLPSNYHLQSFVAPFSVAASLGAGLTLLGGPTVLFISLALIKIFLSLWFYYDPHPLAI